jgi:hypothetical protein
LENKKWFTLLENVIRGPFTKEDIENRITVLDQALIWGRGTPSWIPPKKWLGFINETSKNTELSLINEARLWRIALDGRELEPMPYQQMMNTLKLQSELSKVKIWTEGYSDWKEVFQIHKIMDDLGVSRRTHPRIPIMGTLTCEGTLETFTARVLSISEGGLGATDKTKVKIGEKLKLTLKSTQFHTPIQATAEVVYIGNDDYFGMKFVLIQREFVSAIIEYINKFQANPVIKT